MAKKVARFLNRELSWLEFNQRVLDEAFAAETPLLERLKFLAITGSNLDEFFMVRVGGLQILCEAGSSSRDPAGLTPTQQLRAIETRVNQMMIDQYACFEDIESGLAEKGIRRVLLGEMNDRQRNVAEQVFLNEIFPILTPIAATGRDDFPQLVNHTLNICVRLAPDEDSNAAGRFAVIPLGLDLPEIEILQLGLDIGLDAARDLDLAVHDLHLTLGVEVVGRGKNFKNR